MGKFASEVITQAKSWIGKNEANGSHKEIIDIYNNHKPLARGYRVKYTDSWCATFVSAVVIKLGFTDIIPTECGCGEQIKLWQKMGCWVEDDTRIPKPGDIIYYDWNDTGRGDNTGWPDHVGIVERVFNNVITVIEGNYDNAVKRREIKVNAKNIRGYGVPKYDVETAIKEGSKKEESKITTTNTKSQGGCKVELKVLKRNSSGSMVRALQTLLVGYGYSCGSYGIDGNFGASTEAAVKKYQKAKGLEIDGMVGPKTWAKLLGV